MALAYLFDPNKQFQDRNGVNNVSGFLRVYYEDADDRATTYKNFIGTLNPADIPLDNDGRAVVIVDEEKTYRLEVYERNGNLLWTQHPVFPQGGGGSFEQVQSNWDEEDPTSAAFIKNKPDVKKGRLHRIGVRLVQESDPSPKPMTDWVIDLESPNSEEPDGYDRLTVARAKEIHENGEVFAFTSYSTGGLANNKDTYYESIFNSSSSYLSIVLTKTSNHQNPAEISRAVISDYGDYVGVMDASADSEYLNITLVQEDSDALRKNKIHRYSFGDGTVDGETPIYGSWLIDLDKPDPDGPEGYARVTPAEFWNSTAVNGEVPVYLQDKNANNSLTYAYLSRTDVTKSGYTVTNVFAYFVRSGYGNDLDRSVGFRFTKYNGSDYLQKATSSDDSFNALSITGDGSKVTVDFTEAVARANITTGEKLSVLFGKIKKWFTDLATVAFSGSYNDLSNKPSIPAAQVNSDWNANSGVEQILNKPNLATVATSGSYSDLTNKPTTVNVNQVDSNTDTSSFTFVNGHIYHLTMYLQGSLMVIESSESGTGFVIAYIGSFSTLAHYICRQFVYIQNGRITTDDIRLPIDWNAENISSASGDNQLHIKVIFNNQSYTFKSTSVYDLTLMGTDLSGA